MNARFELFVVRHAGRHRRPASLEYAVLDQQPVLFFINRLAVRGHRLETVNVSRECAGRDRARALPRREQCDN